MKITRDITIRRELYNLVVRELYEEQSKTGHPARIFSEFGINHGVVRADIVAVNGIMHGYEIKSDADTLERLPKQVSAYNTVFDKVTLVVGERHIIKALSVIPDWWGVKLAKVTCDNAIKLRTIRNSEFNPKQDKISIAKLLWKDEAIDILESLGEDDGIRAKNRDPIYERLASVLGENELKDQVRDRLFHRLDWRADQPLLRCDG